MVTADSDKAGVVAILLATYNGARFLDAQLSSIARQDWPRIAISASDDGSDDETVAVLRRWQGNWEKGDFHIADGPRKGFAENFRALLSNPGVVGDHYAFSDQDDLWDADKLSRALTTLDAVAPATPGLYCSRTRLIDEGGAPIGLSPLFPRRPDFRNALVQSIAGGNTMVMNGAAHAIISESVRRTAFVSHDWWCYLMVTGAGGVVAYDAEPHIAYRQHEDNLVGDNNGLRARADRFRRLFAGQLADWNGINLLGLEKCADLLSDSSRAVAEEFRAARRAALPARLYGIAHSRVYRQTRVESLSLWLAAAVNRL